MLHAQELFLLLSLLEHAHAHACACTHTYLPTPTLASLTGEIGRWSLKNLKSLFQNSAKDLIPRSFSSDS